MRKDTAVFIITHGRVEKQGKLFGDCGLCHQSDADGTLKEKDTGGIWKRRKGTDFL